MDDAPASIPSHGKHVCPLLASLVIIGSHARHLQDRMDLADMARPETNLEAFRDKGFDF